MATGSCLGWCLVLFIALAHVQGEVLKSLLWDARNTLFEERCGSEDNVDYARIFVNSMAKLSFVCPSSAVVPRRALKPVSPRSLFENLYIVSKQEFENCEVNAGNPDSRLLLTCDQAVVPNYLKYFTVVFRQWRTSSNGLRFTPNQTYYFIATSNGTRSSLLNRRGGHCKTRNMRLAVTICGWDCSSCENMCCLRPPASSPSPPAPTVRTITRPLSAQAATARTTTAANASNANDVAAVRNISSQRVDDNKVVNTQPQQSAGSRTGASGNNNCWWEAFIIGAVSTAVVLGFLVVVVVVVLRRKTCFLRPQNYYGSDVKTQIDVSPPFHKTRNRGSGLQRLYSSSSSASQGSGTNSL